MVKRAVDEELRLNVREGRREARGANWGESVWHDARLGLRLLRHNPGYASVAVLTLGLGIGANATLFSLLKARLFPALPYAESGRLVVIYRTSSQSRTWPHSRADFLDYREQNHVFSSLSAYHWEGFNFGAAGKMPERLTAVLVTGDFFPMLGAHPALGRLFSREETEAGASRVTVLSHQFWLRHFAGDTNVIGQTLRFDSEPVTVIGVMPAAFDFPMLWGEPDVWRPLVMTAEEKGDRGNRFLNVMGKFKPDASLAQAQAEMTALFGRMAREYPQYDGGSGLRVVPLARSFWADNVWTYWFLFCLTGFVLLIACANLATLQLARTTRRARELAVRAALGATRRRLMNQLLTESLLLSLIGGLAGLVVAWWCDDLFTNSPGAGFKLVLDVHVLVLALASCLVTTVLCGVVPAWAAVGAGLNERLKEGIRTTTGAPSQQRLQRLLVAGEVALALMLLSGAGASARILHRFVRLDPGWDPEGLVTAQVSVARAQFSSERRLAFFRQIEERAAALPGIQFASFATDIPIVRFWNEQPFQVSGQPPRSAKDLPLASCPTVGPAYFQALRIRLREGRAFVAEDKLDRPLVVIVNESLVRRFWPGQSPLGKRISLGEPAATQWREIVGVVNDVHFPADAAAPETPYQIFRPWAQDDIALGGTIILRTIGATKPTAAALRRALTELDPSHALRRSSISADSTRRGSQEPVGD